MAIAVEAIVMTSVIWAFVRISDSHSILLMQYDDNFFIKTSVSAFIILNGIILPFLMPYWIFSKFNKKVDEEVRNGINDARAKRTALYNEINLFLKKYERLRTNNAKTKVFRP